MASNITSESMLTACVPGIFKFSSVLDTNYAPTHDEISEIRVLLKEPALKLKVLQEEAANAHKIYVDLVEQIESLSSQLQRVRALLSPMRCLPFDIIQEIFSHCLPKKHNAVMSINDCPVLLTRICRSWRNVALSTPRLWASIHIPVPSLKRALYPDSAQTEQLRQRLDTAVRNRVAGIRQWLGRSGALPLSISFSNHNWKTDKVDPQCDAIIGAFLPFHARWRRLELASPALHLDSIAATTDVQMLETITIDESRTTLSLREASKKWEQSALLKAPNLREVSFNKLSSGLIPRLPLSWSQLTLLSIDGFHNGVDVNIYQAVQALKPCVRLVTLRLLLPRHYGAIRHPDETSSDASWSLFLPSLHDLTIQDGGKDLTPLFQNLETPSLEALQYMGLKMGGPQFPGPSFLPSFLNGTPTVKKLTLDPEHFNRELFIQTVQNCSGLTSLYMREWLGPGGEWDIHDPLEIQIVDDDFLNLFLSTNDKESYICPDLEDFECQYRAGFTDEGMLDFIRRKQDGSMPAVAKLKRVHVDFDRPQTFSIEEEARRLVEDGLKLHTSYYDGSYHPDNSFSAFEGIENPE